MVSAMVARVRVLSSESMARVDLRRVKRACGVSGELAGVNSGEGGGGVCGTERMESEDLSMATKVVRAARQSCGVGKGLQEDGDGVR